MKRFLVKMVVIKLTLMEITRIIINLKVELI